MTNKGLTLNLIRDTEEKLNKPYLIISWNIDGYTDDVHKWLLALAITSQPDIIFLSETKKPDEHLKASFTEFTNYNVIINAHIPTRWHGVSMLIRKDHSYEQMIIQMNIPVRSDNKTAEASIGRIIAINLNKHIYVIGSYTPNSGHGDASKLYYRTQLWDPAFFQVLESLRLLGPTVWIGDINVALDNIDVSNPKVMAKFAGFSQEERSNFLYLLRTENWIDIWRHQHPTERIYTWCGHPPRPDYGLRLDNIIISKSLLNNIINTFMIKECPISSDHIPVCVYINPPIP